MTQPNRGSRKEEPLSVPLAIIGAGPAGCAAAVAASRLGAEVHLIERYGFPGGMAAAGLVHPWMTYYAGERPIIGGIFAEIVEKLKARNAFKDSQHFGQRHHCFDPEVLKQVLLDMLLEAGVRLSLHTFLVSVEAEQEKIHSLLVASKSGSEEISTQIVIDATGDGDLAAWAGAPYEKGRPQDGLMQPTTLHFRMA
ncbi:MAG: FAD-dependent oxidoreductase, partial [Armatimonadetes bacterium]|nr:FAD-dependent oxidoreductase [Armatimonadota bacterium]NIM23211.1 FAD-dependent oxidoreductase [Armatimonadota bacterium]NIM67079.1 FAD-dependent oxidoreductase [Armatimonadota bacterium]NIM75606.1 FAD-dependent oxidoreductase [Armatimonadota bacterium]NIN05268.1 FAD-dependent oxidoreductase [Armatimonadota bacterium]